MYFNLYFSICITCLLVWNLFITETNKVFRWCGSVNSGKDHLENNEIREVVMGTKQMSVKMFLILTDEMSHFHNFIISDVWKVGRVLCWFMNI